MCGCSARIPIITTNATPITLHEKKQQQKQQQQQNKNKNNMTHIHGFMVGSMIVPNMVQVHLILLAVEH